MNPGEPIWWHYRPPAWQPGDAEALLPHRLVDETGDLLVAWLAAGTEVLRPVLPDGAEVRTLPVQQRFTAGRSTKHLPWAGPGVLRLAPARRPWTVMIFQDDDGFAGWYVNLEHRTGRDGPHVYAVDHVLDVWIDPDGTVTRKDEDELDSAVAAGRFTPGEADAFRADAERAGIAFANGDPEFARRWTSWRPSPDWMPVELPPDAHWDD